MLAGNHPPPARSPGPASMAWLQLLITVHGQAGTSGPAHLKGILAACRQALLPGEGLWASSSRNGEKRLQGKQVLPSLSASPVPGVMGLRPGSSEDVSECLAAGTGACFPISPDKTQQNSKPHCPSTAS